jgi:myo-inositol-1-phosphate synthase
LSHSFLGTGAIELVRAVFFGYGNGTLAVLKLIQRAKKGEDSGIWHQRVGGYSVADIDVAAIFEIDSRRLFQDGVHVKPGLTYDSVPAHIPPGSVTSTTEDDILEELGRAKADVAVNMISSGQNQTSKVYARLCAQAGVAFANATSAPVAQDADTARDFATRSLPLAGDDLMSQLGGTILHRGLIDLLSSRGISVSRSYQLDVGGSTDTLNTIAEEVRAQKRAIKSGSIASELNHNVETVAGTTDYVEFLGSRRTVYLWLEGFGALGEPYTLDVFFKSSDPANASNVVLDVIRGLAMDKEDGRGGVAETLSAYAFKNPPKPVKARLALAKFEELYTA